MTWLVTGASHGVGLELLRLLVARGDVVLASGQRPVADLPPDFPDCRYVPCDLSDPHAVAVLVERAKAEGPLRAAILNAGMGYFRRLDQETPADMARVMAVNLSANITLAHGLHDVLQGGTLGLIGSVAHKGAAGMPVYAASKAALDGFGRALAEEWRGRITVRVLHLGPVATGMSARAGRAPDLADRFFLPPRATAATLLRALDARRGADRQNVSFLRVGLNRLMHGAA